MIFKRFIFIILSLFIALSSFGCIGFLLDGIPDDSSNDKEVKVPPILEIIDSEIQHSQETGDTDHHDDQYTTDSSDETHDLYAHDLYTLDMSSAEAFIADLQSTYNIEFIDRRGYLYEIDGVDIMHELNLALSLFTPTFLRALVAEYEEYGARFILNLEGPSSTEFGFTEWDRNLTITLHYDRDPDENGVTAAVLAHELAHAVHFIIEEYIGETQSMEELRYFNGAFDYVGEDYDRLWNQDIHDPYFAYDYGMYDYYEDFATIIEVLVAFPDEMLERFSVYSHEALTRKTMYIREIMFYHISDTCFPIFIPLYEAEAVFTSQAA